ncbi:putative reverse transcriptase zinc-binding domain-containing protein [Helianthus annuus]|uniref:Reverse transcriptase zinc-binding domain-containing protein n=1 Tax=Helianthus annuus TaxID=4232 RepID=A0A9K3JK24_HELAN|nr:putative reverse transcriptase zinc-binding domain-containing protein [Helianthus annuus]KAJ0603000.1 putative reverse transcriptase zinc-binding domain-containing protein [Helianthus annuus]KAJ0937748.1 putative reverse transcriptase zinc-binding domain-containing protein [Helianthus annuus]
MIKKILWGGSTEERKMHWVVWDRVARNKKEGGLGLCKLQEVNTSLLSKWGWRYKTERNNLWKRIIDALHFSRVGWECIPFKKTLSGVWNNIAKLFINTKIGGLPLRNYLKGEVGRGSEISFWLDPWVINEPLKLKFPELFRMESEKKCTVADRIKNQGMERVFVWNWKLPLIDPVVVSEFQQLFAAIEAIQLTDRGDRWIWMPDKEGKFSVKAVKKLLHSENVTTNGFVMDWCRWIPAKCNIHVWRLEMERIPTGEALKKRNVQIGDSVCPLCFSAEESSLHLFTGCLVAANIWNGISSWCKIPNIFAFSIKDLLGIHKEIRASERKKEAAQGIIMLVCWSIWRARNNLIFSSRPIRIDSIISEVKAMSFLWFSNRSKHRGIDWDDWYSFVNM